MSSFHLMPREEAGSIDGYQASITAKMIINALNDIETLVIVFAVLITLSMVIRVYVRLTMTKVWGREDWAMVVTYRLVIYGILALHTTTGLAYFCFPVFTCAQLKALQGLTDSCAIQSASTAVFSLFSVMNIISDFTFTIMAVVALWKAKLPVPTKVSACALLLLGCVGGIASAIRLAYVLQPTDQLKYTQQLFDLS
ncbi:hypothetical protein C1H76_5232 [Elsinoe australis]|uniref:Rhodopsin domain-containing protein n=1 Tax=Elsinoe australis TaxID=40998 RepID=A0A4U7B0E7_9PEZI|nr:hypothetical protein C1H76_5232 [Elsinoe australis]